MLGKKQLMVHMYVGWGYVGWGCRNISNEKVETKVTVHSKYRFWICCLCKHIACRNKVLLKVAF